MAKALSRVVPDSIRRITYQFAINRWPPSSAVSSECSPCSPDSDVYAEWERLAIEHEVIGKKAHDARIVAAMNVYGITSILTFNVDDFAR